MNTPAATVCNPYRRMFSLAILPRYKPKQNSVARVTLKEVMYASKMARIPFIASMKGIREAIAVNAGEPNRELTVFNAKRIPHQAVAAHKLHDARFFDNLEFPVGSC